MKIVKADGTIEEFRPNKLRTSLRRAGAGRGAVAQIVSAIEQDLSEGARTEDIYRKAFELLREEERGTAAKYSLRRAIFNLGPTGFPFEDYLARLFESEGYTTKRRLLIRGKCALHEIDIAAYKPEDSFVAEAKFHASPGIKSDLQVALYSYARYLDLKSHAVCKDDECGIDSLYVITNTKFTTAAIKYAQCSGIKLLSWDYPKENTLQDRIERSGLYPVTVLTTLSSKQKQSLLAQGVIVCQDLFNNSHILSLAGIPDRIAPQVLEEAAHLCHKRA